jgi:hypothetical protein
MEVIYRYTYTHSDTHTVVNNKNVAPACGLTAMTNCSESRIKKS